MKVWIDGQIVEGSEARIPVLDHGLLYGDGVFEGIRVYGGAIFAGAMNSTDGETVTSFTDIGMHDNQAASGGAVLITEGDDAAFVLDYLQRVAGQRPDIELYNRVGRGTDLLQWREHALSAREQNQLRLQRERALLQQGRQVALADWDFAPAGLVYHLRPKGAQAVPIGTEIEMANGLADGFARDAWVRKIQSNYWFMAGEQRLWAGDIDRANTAFEQAVTVAYDSRSTRFNVALKLYRNNELDRAVEHAEAYLRGLK